MQIKSKIIGAALVSSIMLSGGITQVYADSDPEIDKTELQEYINKIDFLYVIEKEQYNKMMEKNVALLSIKDHLLVIDSENITEEEEARLSSSKEFFIVGDLNNKLKALKSRDNFKDDLLGKNRSSKSIKFASKNSKNKDILIANANSLADSLNALQMSKVSDKALILVENKLSSEAKKYIKKNGKNKEISFVEGEKTIDEKMKNSIMKLANNDIYELNKEQFIKSGSISTKEKKEEKDLNIALNVENQIPEDKVVSESSTSETTLFKGLNSNMSKSLQSAANKSMMGTKTNFNVKEKTISLEIPEETKTKEISQIVNSESVEVVKDNEKKSNKILKSKKKEGYSVSQISVTKGKPVDKEKLSNLKKKKAEFYIVPKKINDELLQKVKDGEYGSGPERKVLLENDGYSYEKVQTILKKEEDEAKQKREEEERQARIEAERSANAAAALRDANQSNVINYGGAAKAPENVLETAPSDVNSTNLEKFLSSLTSMSGWTYSQPRRMEYGYADCSSIILRAMLDAGITSNSANMTTRSIHGDPRFYQIPFDEARKGDVLWTPGHVEVYMGGNTTFGAFQPGIKSGYSTGKNRFQSAFRIKGL